MNKVYCKGCHIEISKGASHTCIQGERFAQKRWQSPFYFRDKKGRFTNVR
jgi:hypothetical protein